jgi:hypothetical protein
VITFLKDLLPVNPVYNDCIIQFSSTTITDAVRAVITIDEKDFVVVPMEGIFIFNFKEIVKNLINTNRFADTIIPDLTSGQFMYSDANIEKQYLVVIRVYSLAESDSHFAIYKFRRSVDQLPNYNHLVNINAPVKVLLPTKNYVDYHVKYTEGFPFDIAIAGLAKYYTYYFKNITINQYSEEIYSADNDVKRLYLSDGANSATDMDYLVQPSTLNKIELFYHNQFVANIFIQKEESRCGVYLKWLNNKGSYSYWLFNSIFKDTIIPRTIDDFAGAYDNLQNLTATSHLIGKTATRTLQLSTTFTNQQAEYISDLVLSPHVQMYVHNEPFQQQQPFDFIGVKVSDTAFQVNNKTSKNKLSLTITLPQLNTIIQ